jgi:ribosome-binding protein aMBF1 (putative translation factor)
MLRVLLAGKNKYGGYRFRLKPINTPIMTNVKKVADNIRYARLHRNYSQDYLAMKLNISQNAYSKLELGYTRVTMKRLFIIAEVLEVDVAMFITDNMNYKIAM